MIPHSILITTLLIAGVSTSRNSGSQENPCRSSAGGRRSQQSPFFDVSVNLKATPPPSPKSPTSRPTGLIPGIVGNPVVALSDGALRGFTMRTVAGRRISAFQGIPFAQAPVGPLRFRDPEKNSRWKGIRDAIAQSPQCIQLDVAKQMEVHGQEDCLYINVYAPHAPSLANRRLPVMVWIHGGGFFFGAGSIYGPAYLLDEDIVLVTFNYRLGPFGLFTTGDSVSPGNQGLKDQTLALKWVQKNIAAFGGDSKSVTIFGQSAGGASVQLHIVSPLSKGLFHRAISQSGSALDPWTVRDNQVELGKRIAEFYNCSTTDSQQMIDCMRRVDASELPKIQLVLAEWDRFPLPILGTVVEANSPGAFLVETPEEAHRNKRAANVPLIAGFTHTEAAGLVAGLILQTDAVREVNTEWDRVGPLFLSISNRTRNDVEIVRRLWDFYLPGQNFTFESRHAFSKMVSDRIIIEGSLEAMRYHSMSTSQPVYAYQFNFAGDYSNVAALGQNPRDWGIVHQDDLIYLVNNTDYYHQLNQSQSDDEEREMSRLMTNIWSNFARYGRPYITTDRNIMDVWELIPQSTSRFSPLRFLDLKLEPKMMDDPYVDRYNFWRGLNLRN